MKKFFKNTYLRIKTSSFFIHNNKFDNFIIILASVTLLVIAIDIQSEIARDKREIENMIVILEKTQTAPLFYEFSKTLFDLEILHVVRSYNVTIQTNDVKELYRPRGPPLLPLNNISFVI